MSRADNVKNFIAAYKKATTAFHTELCAKCPEMLSWDVLQGLLDDQSDSIDNAFFGTLSDAEMADSRYAYTHQQEENDRERAYAS